MGRRCQGSSAYAGPAGRPRRRARCSGGGGGSKPACCSARIVDGSRMSGCHCLRGGGVREGQRLAVRAGRRQSQRGAARRRRRSGVRADFVGVVLNSGGWRRGRPVPAARRSRAACLTAAGGTTECKTGAKGSRGKARRKMARISWEGAGSPCTRSGRTCGGVSGPASAPSPALAKCPAPSSQPLRSGSPGGLPGAH